MIRLPQRLRISATSVGLCLAACAIVQGGSIAAAGGPAGETLQPSATDPRRMTFPTVDFNPPEPERRVLENGMVVYLLEDRELPLVTISATMRAGGWLDPPVKVGLAALAGVAMRTGGSASLPAEELDEELERLAANLSVSIGVESGVSTLDLLKKDLDRGLTIFADVLRRPRFDPGRVDLAKLQAKESIRRRYD